MKLRKWLVFILIILVLMVTSSVGYLIFAKRVDVLSPLSDNKTLINKKRNIKVIGFLPTWMVGKTIEYTDEISHLVFLGVEVDEKGNLIWDYQAKKIDDENYLKQKELIWKNGGRNILGIKLFKDKNIDGLMASIEAQNNLVEQLKTLKKDQKFDGVNIDFEYQGDSTAVLSEEIINFVARLKSENLGEISLDVFVNTIIKGSAEQIGSLINSVDYLIVMAYDFHRPGVDYVGAVAPIGSVAGDRNIMEVVEKVLFLNLDKEKIIMAYPLYGYEWKTYSEDFESRIKRGWYLMASWNRVKELIREKNLEVKWDELSMTPWLVFRENGQIHQIYFENERSLKIKVDLVRQNQFGGIGFWALGYDGKDKNIWDLVRDLVY